jgi:hypothetical protein
MERDLVNRSRAGVDVQVILNAAYDGASENATAAAVLRAGSVHVVWAPSNQIFHAKYLVVDNSIAYIGTGNFVPSDFSSTRDFWISDTQPHDVSAIVATFNGDFAGGGTTSHQSGGLVWSPGSTASIIGLISTAHRTLLVENEEMDSSSIEEALIAAARRGVVVDVVMTEDSEWTVALNRLAAAGVHLCRLHRWIGDSLHWQREFLHFVAFVQSRTRRHHVDARRTAGGAKCSGLRLRDRNASPRNSKYAYHYLDRRFRPRSHDHDGHRVHSTGRV